MPVLKSKPSRIAVDDISDIARQGVSRALEARKAAGIELTQEEIGQVGGGVSLSPLTTRQLIDFGIIAGGIFGPIDMLGKLNPTQLG